MQAVMLRSVSGRGADVRLMGGRIRLGARDRLGGASLQPRRCSARILATPAHQGRRPRGPLAQLAEQGPLKPKVVGSIPTRPIGGVAATGKIRTCWSQRFSARCRHLRAPGASSLSRGPVRMRMWLAGICLLALASLIAVPVGGIANVAGSTLRPSYASAVPGATLPLRLLSLEQKMQQLHVNSERYTRTSRGSITVVNEANGKPVGRGKLVSLDQGISGEISISPLRFKEINLDTGKPIQIQIGPVQYTYSRKTARKHPHRAWVIHKEAVPLSALFPYATTPDEVSQGGEGSYARLFNLLATAVGAVHVLGRIPVKGQSTTEFSADIEPLRLIQGLTVEDVQRLKQHPVFTKLDLFLSEAGYPLRVTVTQNARYFHYTETTDITAVEVPLSVSAPPARETIGSAETPRMVEHRRHTDTAFISTIDVHQTWLPASP